MNTTYTKAEKPGWWGSLALFNQPAFAHYLQAREKMIY